MSVFHLLISLQGLLDLGDFWVFCQFIRHRAVIYWRISKKEMTYNTYFGNLLRNDITDNNFWTHVNSTQFSRTFHQGFNTISTIETLWFFEAILENVNQICAAYANTSYIQNCSLSSVKSKISWDSTIPLLTRVPSEQCTVNCAGWLC